MKMKVYKLLCRILLINMRRESKNYILKLIEKREKYLNDY